MYRYRRENKTASFGARFSHSTDGSLWPDIHPYLEEKRRDFSSAYNLRVPTKSYYGLAFYAEACRVDPCS